MTFAVCCALLVFADVIFFSITSPRDPISVLYSQQLDGSAATALTPPTPAPRRRKLTIPQEVAVSREDGGEVHCMVYRQAEALVTSTEPQPSLLWIHGGPSSVDRWGFNGRAQYFANLGFVVVTVNYRGSSGLGLAHHDAVLGNGVGKADLEDCVAAAAHIRTHAAEMGVDLSRGIGVGGHSWGGYQGGLTQPFAQCRYRDK